MNRVEKKIIGLIIGVTLTGTSYGVTAQTAEHGKTIFAHCSPCHSLQPLENLMGPSLHGLFGRPAGTAEGFRFTNAVKKSGIVWNQASLNKYLENPQALIPGNRMSFSGMADPSDRSDLIEYLQEASQ
jgi:cytochrome c